ncbi:COG4223 family protein [Ahrensia kielensis]|uniref:COG4223 family protein n=1 Tax=Ahrensia kielensis TaxID=76980 RepID=UPI0003625124|nr:hypothetical protein [Ahrensia kielensis]
MARSNNTRRTPNTRKPVTIDLEAKPVETDDVSVDTTPTDSVDVPADESQTPEPVAFDALDDKKSEKPDADDSPSNPQEEAAPSAAPSAKKSGNGGSGAVMGGLIGGLIALIGLGGLQWANVLPSFGSAQTQAADTTLLETDIATLKSQLAKLEETSSGNNDAAAMSSDVEAQLSAASIAFEKATTRIQVIEQSVADLGEKVGALESNVSSAGTGEAGSISVAVSEQLSALTEQLSGLEENIAQQGTKLSAVETALTEQINALESRVVSVEDITADGNTNAGVATAIASAGLKSAIDRGGSFMAELEAFATVSQKAEIIDGLRNYAAAGVPTINQLSDEFSSVANKIVATGQGLDENASVTERLMQSARSLVQVRPVGEVEGETPGAIAARIETRLKSSDLAGALAQWETLPEAAKNVSAAFAEKMRARQSVDELVAQALTSAMATTSAN